MIGQINNLYPDFNEDMRFAINLTDGVGGSWSHFSTVDYSSKFDMNPLLKRRFSVVLFWISEEYDEQLLRTIYWKERGKPATLADHIQQENFVQSHFKSQSTDQDSSQGEAFIRKYSGSTDFNVIFNFFYGDEASQTLGYITYGMNKITGFDFIKHYLSYR